MEEINPYEVIRKRFESNVNGFVLSDLFQYTSEKNEDLIEDIKNSKIVIYTAFTKGYDSLKTPEFIDENCDYVCFTDDPNLTSDFWDIRLMEDSYLDNNRKAKQYKVFPHIYFSDYKYSFWIDGTFQIKSSVREYIYKFAKSKMLCVVHPERDCIFEEAQGSIPFARYSNYTICKQVNHYKDQGMPKNYGLPALGLIFRQHNDDEIINLMEEWWDEIIKFTNQDQLSFVYLCWKNDFHPSVAPIYYWDNEFFAKDGEYHHKEEVEDYICSRNIINKFENDIQEENVLTKEELSLLINDIEALQDECLALNQIRNNTERKILNLTDSKSWKLTESLRRNKKD